VKKTQPNGSGPIFVHKKLGISYNILHEKNK